MYSDPAVTGRLNNKIVDMSNTPKIATGRFIIFMLILSIVLIAAVKFWPRSSRNTGNLTGARENIGVNTNVPKEIQVKYLPASFKFEIDEEDAVAIISNPLRYKREFNDLVRNMNLAILDHVGTRMNLDESIRGQIRAEYEKSHP